VIVSFKDQGTQDVYDGVDTKAARKTCPREIWRVAIRKLDMIEAAAAIKDLRAPRGNRLEGLAGDRAGQYSIRINDQYRVCFLWGEQGAEEIEITDYHS
jgi:toxin HigB-1